MERGPRRGIGERTSRRSLVGWNRPFSCGLPASLLVASQTLAGAKETKAKVLHWLIPGGQSTCSPVF
jgi:hypothetical protein